MTTPPTFVPEFNYGDSVAKTVYNQLGNTDMVVSRMGFGAAPIGGAYGPCEEAEGVSLVKEVVKSGINYIDTAYWYGQGKSEAILGKAFSEIPRKAFYVATKVGLYDPLDPAKTFDYSAEKVLDSIDQSLARLGLPYVDLLQIHDPQFAPSLKLISEETLPALEKVRNSGKTRYIGITGYPSSITLKVLQESRVKIDTIISYCRATLHDSSLSEFIPKFQELGVGIINASPTSMGLLTSGGPPGWHLASDDIKSACYKATKYCEEREIDISKLAVHFSVNFPGVHTTLVGAHSLPIFKRNLDIFWNSKLSDAEAKCLEEIQQKFFAPIGNAHWEDKNTLQAFLDNIKKALIVPK